MISFAAGVHTIYLTAEIRDTLRQVQLWSLAAGLAVNVGSLELPGPSGVIGTMSGRAFALSLAVDGDRRDDTARLAAHLRAALPSTFGVVFRGAFTEVNWDARRRAPRGAD